MSLQTQISSESAAEQIRAEGLIAIVRGNFPLEKLIQISDALLASPVLVMEVTLNTTGALDAIATLRARYGENMLIGAGTVRTVEQLHASHGAGAQFTVSPNLDLETVTAAQRRDVQFSRSQTGTAQ